MRTCAGGGLWGPKGRDGSGVVCGVSESYQGKKQGWGHGGAGTPLRGALLPEDGEPGLGQRVATGLGGMPVPDLVGPQNHTEGRTGGS